MNVSQAQNGWQCDSLHRTKGRNVIFSTIKIEFESIVAVFCPFVLFFIPRCLVLSVHDHYIVILQMCFTDMPTAVSSNTWRNIKSNQTAKCFYW